MLLIVFGDSRKGSQVRGRVLLTNMVKWKILFVFSLMLLMIQCSKAAKIYGGELCNSRLIRGEFELVLIDTISIRAASRRNEFSLLAESVV